MTADAGDLAYPDNDTAWIEIDDIVFKSGPWIPVSSEVLRDWGWFPWASPHRNPMPLIVLFPRLAHTIASVERTRQRLVDAFGVLLHGLPERDDDAW